MKQDNTLDFVIPAISLNYSVHPDNEGRLMFRNENCCIKYRNHGWIVTDINNDQFHYSDLQTALIDFRE